MTETEEINRKWAKTLRAMLTDYRYNHPSDYRTDRELLDSLMNHFYKNGLIGKDKDGRWILPDIDGSISLIN